MTQILKPCPFGCEGDPVLLETNELRPDKYQREVHIRCDTCGCELSSEYEHEVIAAWNTRLSDPDELREALTEKQIDEIYDALPKRPPAQDPIYSRTAIRLIGNATLTALSRNVGDVG